MASAEVEYICQDEGKLRALIYTQLVDFEGDEFHSATAKSVKEAQRLIEEGFEFVCDYVDIKLFRKRK